MTRRRASIEFRHLRYFVTAAEQGSIRKASSTLGLQQSTISRALRDLEDIVGATLFNRFAGGVSLTAAGEQFLKPTRLALEQIDSSIGNVSAAGRGTIGNLKVGIFSSLASGFLAELLCAYGARFSAVGVDLVDGSPVEHVSAIRQLRLDVAFIVESRKWTDCETRALWSERLFVVLPRNHFLTRKGEISWFDLVDEHFIVSATAPGLDVRDYLLKRLTGQGQNPNIASHKVGRDILLSLVAAENGLTLTSEATTASTVPGIVYRPIADEIITFSAVWSSRNDNPALRRLLSMARTMSNISAS